jgi:hypothetical protein
MCITALLECAPRGPPMCCRRVDSDLFTMRFLFAFRIMTETLRSMINTAEGRRSRCTRSHVPASRPLPSRIIHYCILGEMCNAETQPAIGHMPCRSGPDVVSPHATRGTFGSLVYIARFLFDFVTKTSSSYACLPTIMHKEFEVPEAKIPRYNLCLLW